MKFRTIQQQRKAYPVAMMCRLLAVSTSGYYAWTSRPESRRAREDRALAVEIRAEFARSKGRYGSPRIVQALRRRGRRVGRRRTARIMRQEGLVARPRRRRPRPASSRASSRAAPNLLTRNFSVDAPNKVWMSDITYIATRSGWVYLAVVLDLYSRRVVGWSLAGHMRQELALEALDMAIRRRGPGRGVLHHSDRGSQYASDDYLRALASRGFVASMSRKGDCWDNAVCESFFATLKTELGARFDDEEHARTQISEYIEDFYNYRRLHSSLGYASPAEYEIHPQPAARAA